MRELKLLLTYQPRLLEENERRMAAMEDEKSRLTGLLETSKSTIETLRVNTAQLRDRIDAILRELEEERKETREGHKAERGMRQLANERKNSGFYGSHKMAAASTVYHSLIATCRKVGISVKQYFNSFLKL